MGVCGGLATAIADKKYSGVIYKIRGLYNCFSVLEATVVDFVWILGFNGFGRKRDFIWAFESGMGL